MINEPPELNLRASKQSADGDCIAAVRITFESPPWRQSIIAARHHAACGRVIDCNRPGRRRSPHAFHGR